jgi:hypothetical protein
VIQGRIEGSKPLTKQRQALNYFLQLGAMVRLSPVELKRQKTLVGGVPDVVGVAIRVFDLEAETEFGSGHRPAYGKAFEN